ncbi:MAG: serpin family protein [Oscillospiraceae bacterium]|nr:serpin family protein [Oscillospiraceae bacterium]
MKQRIIPLILAALLLAGAVGCASVQAAADDLMKGVSSNKVNGKPVDDAFIGSAADFAVELFKKSVSADQNALISPLSVQLALAMTANGAGGETLRQMEALLGGGLSIDSLNETLYSYTKGLPSTAKSKLSIANSIWFRDDEDRLQVQPGFLQANADYYKAAAYKAAFDTQTLKDVNNWVKDNTDGMIKEILEEILDDDVLYLINAIVFDAEWKNVYYLENVRKGDFTDISGTKKKADFMHSSEYTYLEDGLAAGFIKPYENGYSFAALLPNEGISIGEYIASLNGAGFLETLQNAQNVEVYAALPKFEYEYDVNMNDILIALGMPDAFDMDEAEFEKMAVSSRGNIFIDRVIHKTFISVDELGTKAGAATLVAMSDAGAAPSQPKTVRLDRPFVYVIIDNATNLPIFIGTVMNV